ncbi:MAG: universal stress protein [Proteobacteria bacterium]|nr:universal stress protein [Pseudomonadota bacterium]MBU1583853.1 universal stress protein [Pseudomonadota bacterium]MBU2453304.1 universal stress protein [Pseudomonadota bacterium]
MIPKIKKILYATDLSESARHAFYYAADLAQRYDAMVTFLYVMEEMNHTVEFQIRGMLGRKEWERVKSEKLDFLTNKIKSKIEEFCQEMDSQIDSCRLLVEDILIKSGNPTEEIINTSKEINADMVVMGSYGYNILMDALIGGTARKVVKNSKIPVLVVRLPQK